MSRIPSKISYLDLDLRYVGVNRAYEFRFNYNAGTSLGGPIIKDKLFFFGALETQTFSIGQNGGATEPSAAFQTQAKALLSANGVAVNQVAQNLLNTLWPAYALTGPATSSNYTSSTPPRTVIAGTAL